jgi:hypothetical protein
MALGAFVLLVACGSSRQEPAPPPSGAQACGSPVFLSPSCESSVDMMCCTQKVDCSRDPACDRLARCVLGCKHASPRDTCTSNCVTQQQASPEVQRGFALWSRVIDCASKANVPNCGDDS